MPPTTTPKRTRAYTTISGERVTKFNDGSETRVPKAQRSLPMSPDQMTASDLIRNTERSIASASPIAANNVPASVLSAPQTPEVNIPTPTVPQVNAGAAIASAEQVTGSIQEQEAQRQEQVAAQAGQTVSENERRLRELSGIIGTEGQARIQMEESSGFNRQKEQLNQLSNQLFNQTAELREFDRNNVNTIEQMRVDSSKRDITKRTFGAMSAEAGIQMAVQRANMVADIYATQSSVQLLQGNIEIAAENIDKALNAMYEPKRQEMALELQFYQRNGQLFDSAQNRAANARIESIRAEQAVIDRAIATVDAAVASGYASPEDINMMKSMSDNPEAQRNYAQKIVAKAAYDSMALDRAYKNAQIENVYDSINARQEANKARQQELIDAANKTAQEEQEVKSLATEKALSIQALAEKIKNHSALSSAIGPISSTGLGAVGVSGALGKRAEVIALIDQLSGQLTLDNTKFLKGAMSDRDIDLITNAASRLKARGVSEDSYNQALQEIIDASQRTVRQNGLTSEQAQYFGYIDEAEAQTFDALWNTQTSTSAFNPSQFYAE